MNEDMRMQLGFVQQEIARMNANSFQLKTWAVTLTAGLFALSERSNPWFSLLAVAPILLFWILDAFYLKLERQYRNLYQRLCEKCDEPAYAKGKFYSLKLDDYKDLPAVSRTEVAFSKTELGFYLPLLGTVAAVVSVLVHFAR